MRTRRPPCSSMREIEASRFGIDVAPPPGAIEMGGVQQIDDLHVARQQPLHQRHRPGFERFGQEGVVGVGKGRLGDRPGVVPLDPVEIDQNAHQLGDRDRRMRVVELNGVVIAERADVLVLLDVPADQVEQGGGGEEIFLPQPQFLAGRRRVAGVEDLGDRRGPYRLREGADIVGGVEGVELERIGRPGRPQAQRVDVPAAPARRSACRSLPLRPSRRDARHDGCGRSRSGPFRPSRRSRSRNCTPAARTPRDCRL